MKAVLSESAFQEFQQMGYIRPGLCLSQDVLSRVREFYRAMPFGSSNWHCFLVHQVLDRDPSLRGTLRRLLARLNRRWTRWLGPRLAHWLQPQWSRRLYKKAIYTSSELLNLVLGECLASGLAQYLSEIPFLVAHELYLESDPKTMTFGDLNEVHHDGFVWDMFYQTGDDISLYIPLHDLTQETGGRLMVDPRAVESSLYPTRNSRFLEFAEFCRRRGAVNEGGLVSREAVLDSPHRREIGAEYHAMEKRLAELPHPLRKDLTAVSAKAGEVLLFNNKFFHDVEPWHGQGSRSIYIVRLVPLYATGMAPPPNFLNDVPCNRLLLDSQSGRIQTFDPGTAGFVSAPTS